MAAATAWTMHDKAKEYIGDGTIDLDGDTFKLVLYLSTSDIATTSVNAYAAATNEVATNFGYTQAGVTLTSPTWTESSGTVTFDATDMTDAWTASGGSIVCRFAAIYDDTVAAPVAKPILCHTLLDSAPADITVTDGNTLSITFPAGGIFAVTSTP